MTLRERAALAEKAARAAGEMLLAHPHTPARHKAENDFVTEFDVKSEELIRGILLAACPEDGFYGEEEGGSEQAASPLDRRPDRRHLQLLQGRKAVHDFHRL